MKRVLAFILIFIFSFNIKIYANEEKEFKSSILMEASTGKIISDENSDERLKIASVTKLMTLLLVFEAIDSGRITKEDVVTVSEHASSMGGSQIFLEPMEQQSVDDLLKSVVVASAKEYDIIGLSYKNLIK